MRLPVPLNVKLGKAQHVSNYVGELRGITGYYMTWIPESFHDVENFYKYLKNDAAVKHALNLLALLTAGEYWQITSKNQLFNAIATEAFTEIERFTHTRKSMVEKSVLFGLSVQKKYWKKITIPELTGDMVWEVPERFREIDRQRMRIERSQEDRNKLYWTMWHPYFDQYVVLEDRHYMPDAAMALQDYLWYWYEFEETSAGYFSGFGEVLYGLVYIKQKLIQYWADLSEKWGEPFVHATIQALNTVFDSADSAGSGTRNVETVTNAYVEAIESMRGRHCMVTPDGDNISIHEHGSTGNNIIEGLISYIDHKIQLLILGAELTTSAPSVGSYALGKVHEGVTNSTISYNRDGIDETFTRDQLKDFYLRNKWNFYRLGIRWPRSARFNTLVRREQIKEELVKKATPSASIKVAAG